MCLPCTFACEYSAKTECVPIYGIFKGKSALMLYDKHPELGSKFNKSFWARDYYVATVGNLAEDAIKKYIQDQSEKSQKEDKQGAAF